MGGRTLTVGVLTPHVTAGPEIEIPVMSAGHVATVVSRIPLPARSDAGATSPQSLREGARPSALDGAAKAFPHGSVDALAYASTSSGYVTGVPDDGPVSWTAREDAAAAAAAILASNGAYEGPTTVTADEAPTFDDIAVIASEVAGRSVTCTITDEDEWVAGLVSRGTPEVMARFTLGIYQAAQGGFFAGVDPLLGNLLGRRPRTVHDLLAPPAEG